MYKNAEIWKQTQKKLIKENWRKQSGKQQNKWKIKNERRFKQNKVKEIQH